LPERDSGLYNDKQPNMYRLTKIIAGIWVVILLLPSCGSKKKDPVTKKVSIDSVNIISGYGKIEPLNDRISLTSERNGIVSSLDVSEGDTLAAGDTILALDHREEKAGLEKTRARIRAAETAVKLAVNSISMAEEALKNKTSYYQRIKDAWTNHAESGQKLDDARLQYQQAASDLEKARLNKESQEGKLEVLKKEFSESAIKYSKLFITAPEDGTVLSLDVTRGDPVRAYQALGDFSPSGPLSVRAEIDELFAEFVKKGQQVMVVPFGREDTVASGTVVFTSPQLNEKSIFSDKPSEFNDRRVREIKVRINRMAKPLLIGERVNVFIKRRN